MILDKQLEFSKDQAITSTADASNVIDLRNIRDIGTGENLFIFSQVTEQLADSSGSDATVTVALTTDDNETLTSDTLKQTLFTFAHGDPIGTIKYARIQPNDMERYAGLTYTVANGPLSAGKFTSGIVKDITKVKAYPSGYTVA